jgi:hypothetical protein
MQSLESGKIEEPHRISDSEMIDEKINKLCEETGLIKKRIVSMIGLYPALYLSRIRNNSLTAEDQKTIEKFIQERGIELEKFKVMTDPINTIDALHSQFAIFKTRILKVFGEDYQVLERRKTTTPEQQKRLKKELSTIAKHLKSFTF